MPIEDPELLAEFVVEANEHLSDIENQLLAIEADGANINVDLVNTVFRGVHSIKGAAGFLGLTSVKKLAHSLEGVLNLMRERRLVPTPPIIDVTLRAADTLHGMIGAIESSNEVDVSALVTSLDALAAGGGASAPIVGAPSPTTHPSAPSPLDTNIRVSVEVLDHLMNLAGELVLGRNQLLQAAGTPDHLGLDNVATHLDQVTSELQDAIMQTRMQPIGSVFNRFSRVVRDLSNQLGKECELVLEGQEVEVDKTISEAIGDPLTHLVRNSVDHGIEMPADRIAAGKPKAGTLRLRARHQSGKVCIEIEDDGTGIDAGKLREKAVSKGLLTQEQADQMSEREALRLIFHPGFSTAAAVTDVSGRGVGMDVVRNNIERLGGVVEVETRVGTGTTIQIALPLTLAIIPSLIVRSGNDRFAIPQVSIAELVRIRPAEVAARIGRVKNAEVLRLRGTLLPLVRLDECLGTKVDEPLRDTKSAPTTGLPPKSHAEAGDVMNIIVVETGQLRYGLVVDALFDSEEIVVKPLGQHVRSSPCLSGATILGDGRVALILDVAGIATQVNLHQPSAEPGRESSRAASALRAASELHSVLLFTSHPDEQFAVPMTMVARLERIHREQIACVGGQELLQYRGVSLPLISLEHVITAKPRPDAERLFVIVFEAAGHELGLIASKLVDIRSVSAEFDEMTFAEAGVCGSQVIDDRTTRALDVMTLARTARPDWFVQRQACADAQTGGSPRPTAMLKTILLAEDSTFFRRQVKGFLEAEGYRIIECEDGQVAWCVLQAGSENIDLLLTDVEMPNMNGFQLCRRVKDDELLRHIPVVALTSLAGQEDIRRGREAGVDEHQVKLDRENLLAAVRRYAPVERTLAVGSLQ